MRSPESALKRIPLAVSMAVGAAIVAAALPVAAQPAPERARELVTMVRQDCGSCHGLALAGGLGPPLLPANLSDKPLESLVATVLQGRSGSAMPGWSRFMNEKEAEWVVRELVKGFPELPGGERR